MSELTLNPASTALVLIDLEHVIVGRTLAPYSGPEIVAKAASLAAAMRSKNCLVVYVHVDVREILPLPTDSPRQSPGELPANAIDIVPEAGFTAGDVLVKKRQWGAFYGTDLEQHLRRRGIKTIVMGGIATNFGVESTARAAFDEGFEVVFVEDAMTSMSKEMHDFPVKNVFPSMGRVSSCEKVTAALG